MTTKIHFSADYELYAAAGGLQGLPSGTSPYNPDQFSAVRRNSELGSTIGEAQQLRIRAAAARGEDALIAELDHLFVAVGRAREGYWQ